MINGRRIGKLLDEGFGTGLANRIKHNRNPGYGKFPQPLSIGLSGIDPGSR
jgi:hypothetical protein